MGSEFLGLRLNHKKHEEIIEWLERFDDKSEESRRLLLLGIRVSKGEHQATSPESKPVKKEPIQWKFPKEPTVTEKVEESSAIMNILGSFGE